HRLKLDEAIGYTGTIRDIGMAIKANGYGAVEVNAEGLAWLKRKLFKQGDVQKIDFHGIKTDRRAKFTAGQAKLEANFDA
ncbi:exopolyphosphatase, partial [Pseudomonas syringae pv. tagetis]